MRIGCLQFAPQVGDVDNNLNRADAILNKADPKDLDLLVLPELAFSGYNFRSLEHISPFLEPCGSGISGLWARNTALKHNCHVAVGYPEKVDLTDSWPASPEYYNSVVVVNEDGETVANYRKTHLYYTDETWALEGEDGFFEGYIEGLGDTSMGICMDLNPYRFEAPWTAFEFAFHILECQSNLVIVSMAWMTREDGRVFSRMPDEPDMDTLTYWATRLEPLIRVEGGREVIVVFCNRSGMEDEVVYAGTSAVVGILDGEVRVYGVLGRGETELLVVDTDNPPYAKLVQRLENGVLNGRGELQTSEISITPHSARSSHAKRQSRHTENGGPGAVASPPSNTVAASTGETSTLPTARKRPQPQLQCPVQPAFQTTNSNSAVSVKSMGSEIPTPSAPSPTPNGVRPKLMTALSSGSATRQGHSPLPMSALSTYSVTSNASIRSRPPEDSTPYPHSGAPSGAYLRSRVMYDGNVSTSLPTTPFEDRSLVVSRDIHDSEKETRSQIDASSQTSRDTVSTARRRPPRRAFQEWPVLKPRSAGSKDEIQNGHKTADHPLAGAGATDTQLHGVTEFGHPKVRSREESTLAEKPRLPTLQSSPKSRNSSQAGNRGRSHSSSAQRNDEAEFKKLLTSIERRSESTSQTRDGQDSIPSRPESRKGQQRPPSRLVRNESPFVAGASAKLVGPESTRPSTSEVSAHGHRPRRSASRNGVHNRSNSVSEDARMHVRAHMPIHRPQESEAPVSRAVSRGRRPEPHASTASRIEAGIWANSFDSVRESHTSESRRTQKDIVYDPPRPGKPSPDTSSHRGGTGTTSRPSSRDAHGDDEVTFCPNCFHEIRTPSKAPSRSTYSSLGHHRSSQSRDMAASQSDVGLNDQMRGRSASLDSRSLMSNSFNTSGATSTTEISPLTPDYTDMKTPKAIVFSQGGDPVVEAKKTHPITLDEMINPSRYLKEIVL